MEPVVVTVPAPRVVAPGQGAHEGIADPVPDEGPAQEFAVLLGRGRLQP